MMRDGSVPGPIEPGRRCFVLPCVFGPPPKPWRFTTPWKPRPFVVPVTFTVSPGVNTPTVLASALTAIVLGYAITSLVLIENVFAYPGLGYLMVTAVQATDYPLMQAIFFLLTVGRHFGDFTPAITLSSYKEHSTYPDQYVPVRNSTTSFTLRYEVNRSSDLKLQLDRARDSGPEPFAGNATAVSVAYDFVF